MLSGEKALIFKTHCWRQNYNHPSQISQPHEAYRTYFRVIFNGVATPEFTAAVVLAPANPVAFTDTV
jgi:hypothetical protein